MTTLTPEKIKAIYETNPQVLARALLGVLKDFGYTVTADYVAVEIKRLYEGGEPKGGPSMFISNWLKEGIDD